MECENNLFNKILEGQRCYLNTYRYGPRGPRGPAGSANLSSVLIDNDGTQNVSSNALVNLGILINQTGEDITYNNNILTLTPGSYYIVYSALISNVNTPGDVGASLLINNEVIDNASEYVPATTTQTQIVLQHNLTITENATVSIRNSSSVANYFHDSSLSVLKIA